MAKINWKNHAREFIVVVVFGILLAFQLDRCASNKNKQKEPFRITSIIRI